jgi:hypothetical protein
MATLNSILLDSSSYLDLDAVVPSGTELTTRVRFAVMAVNEWAQSYKWRQLKIEYAPSLASFASIGLPNYQYLNGPPMEWEADNTWTSYPEVQPEERFDRDDDDQFCYIMGNDIEGVHLHVKGIDVNATLTIPYVRGPSVMATLTDICEVPDPEFITSRVISYVLQARNDERFPIVIANGNRLLKNMISTEMIRLPGGVNTTPKTGIAKYSIG